MSLSTGKGMSGSARGRPCTEGGKGVMFSTFPSRPLPGTSQPADFGAVFRMFPVRGHSDLSVRYFAPCAETVISCYIFSNSESVKQTTDLRGVFGYEEFCRAAFLIPKLITQSTDEKRKRGCAEGLCWAHGRPCHNMLFLFPFPGAPPSSRAAPGPGARGEHSGKIPSHPATAGVTVARFSGLAATSTAKLQMHQKRGVSISEKSVPQAV